MAIPDYETVMLPIMKVLLDKTEWHIRDVMDQLAQKLGLSDEEKTRMLPSGNDVIFDNRVRWARLYLLKAGLIESPKRGFIKISNRGLTVLAKNPNKIDLKLLQQYSEFRKWKERPPTDKTEVPIDTTKTIGEQTPEEALEYGYQQIRQNLVQQLLELVKDASPKFFEKLVVELLVKMGYGGSIKDAGAVVGGSGDEGIDGVIKEDRLGLDTIYIQAKRWENATVSGSELQKFVGALEVKRANKGVFITTSNFAKSAMEYVERIGKQVVLIDGEELAELMIDYDIGVSRTATYEIKRLDSDYFTEE